MGHKAFKRAANLDPIWFTLGEEDTRFNCEDDIPGGMILDFAGVMEGDDADGNMLKAVKEFFAAAIVPEQLDQFWALVYDKNAKVGLSMLIELAQWLAGEYSDRPTGQSSGDTPQKTSTGGDSTAGALHGVPTYSRPEPVAATT